MLENKLRVIYDAYTEAKIERQTDKHECRGLQGTWLVYVFKSNKWKYNISKYFCNSKPQNTKPLRRVISTNICCCEDHLSNDIWIGTAL